MWPMLWNLAVDRVIARFRAIPGLVELI